MVQHHAAEVSASRGTNSAYIRDRTTVVVMGKNTKLIEASMALLQAAPEQKLNIVVLNKALFYLDLIALRDLGHVITDQEYVALPQGPVVESYKSTLVSPLVKAGFAEALTEGLARPLHVVKPITEFKLLDHASIVAAQDMGRSFSKFTSTLLSDFSHHNPGWLLARKKYVDGLPAPKINMRIAMQQLDHADEWIDQGLDSDLLAAAEKADEAKDLWK